MHNTKILIIDFGSQYTQIIARRVREIGVYCEIFSYDVSESTIKAFSPNGIILSGGPESVRLNTTPRAPTSVFEMGCPVLGICYGMQTMAVQLGGEVHHDNQREFGYAKLRVNAETHLLKDIYDRKLAAVSELDVWMSHGDHVSILPPEFKLMASTDQCAIAGMADENRHFYGLQFHPEVSHTYQGKRILEKFVLDICECAPTWTMKNIIADEIKRIQNIVGQEKVLLALSGGVDSSVAAILLQQAIGDQLICVFVDTGLLRLNEANEVKALFEKHFGIHLICVNAEDEFFKNLSGESDPEKKRKIIGKTFIDIFNREANRLQNIKFLAQGTIYSDVIESAALTSGSHVIKSHHNVGGLPDNMALTLIEPLRELFKDEVREMGLRLGLPKTLIYRHPFPGPGLGVRVLGEVKKEYVETLRLADAILIEELHYHDLYQKVSQAFAVFIPVKSVGVIGDARHYEHVIAIRIVETIDFMTAQWAAIPYDVLGKISNRIINEVPGVSRVTYDISSKPPATIEWE